MIAPDHPSIPHNCQLLRERIKAQGVESWLADRAEGNNLEALVYLCKFAFFTAVITKAEIARILDLDRIERKNLVKGWYDDHREKGCGTC